MDAFAVDEFPGLPPRWQALMNRRCDEFSRARITGYATRQDEMAERSRKSWEKRRLKEAGSGDQEIEGGEA